MTFCIEILFWGALFAVWYVYVGYPLAVLVLGFFQKREIRQGPFEPLVTVLIPAYNEETGIAATIRNKLALDYPRDRLEIIVISDGSTDRTDEIALGFQENGVRLLRQQPRAGKTSALNMAVGQARGDILVFSDANSMYAPDALRKLMRNFSDPEVGYVTGKMIYVNPDGTPVGDGCTAYMKYENFLRRLETGVGSIVGVDGGIDAARKKLYRPMNADQLPDFVLPLNVIDQGYRVVYEPEALLNEETLKTAGDEYRMRVRVALRSLWALWDMRRLLLHPRSRMFAFQLWSHKALRYLGFLFLLVAFPANIVLWSSGGIYPWLLILQITGYLAAAAEPLLERRHLRFRLVHLAHYFFLLNLASAHAFIKFIMGQKQVLWTPRKG
ncbi:MAG: glycosyltransferase family 2 protein [Thermodesulfobacteriota bacterium]